MSDNSIPHTDDGDVSDAALHYNFYIDKANALKKRGDFDAARIILEEGMKKIPEEMWLVYHHAFLSIDLREWDVAVTRWTEFCARFPDWPDGGYFLTRSLFESGNVEEADSTIVKALLKFGPTKLLLEARAKFFEHQKMWNESIYIWNIYDQIENIKKYGLPVELFPKKYPNYKKKSALFSAKTNISAFGYWNTDDHSLLPFISLWSHVFDGRYKVTSDKEAISILQKRYPDFVDIYKQINIPACKSDLARLLYLYEYGGIYIDMHCVLGNFNKLDLLDKMYDRYSAVFFSYPVGSNGYHMGNSIILAKRLSPVIRDVLNYAIAKVREQFHKEAADANAPYNIYDMTGPGNIERIIMGPDAHWQVIVNEYKDLAFCVKMDMTRTGDIFHPFYAYPYRKKGLHWSDRQQKEKLFSGNSKQDT